MNVSLSGLAVRRGGRPVLHGIDLRAEAGEWLAIIGPNGAGKTSLLLAIAGLLDYEGTVTLDGRPAAALGSRALARLIALVPQQPTIPPGITVADYVILGRSAHVPLYRSPGRNDRHVVHTLLAELDLAGLAGRPVAELSGGERQRATLARALAQQAPVLLLDEPTSALDLAFGQQVLDLVADIRDRLGVTVISTMHDLTLAGGYADGLALLAGGRLVARGRAEEVLTEEVLATHYGGRLQVIHHEGRPVVVPAAPARFGV
jgi:iron complex transport system ATP-binding protein